MYCDPAWTARERTLATLLPVFLVGVVLGGLLCQHATALSIALGALTVIAAPSAVCTAPPSCSAADDRHVIGGQATWGPALVAPPGA